MNFLNVTKRGAVVATNNHRDLSGEEALEGFDPIVAQPVNLRDAAGDLLGALHAGGSGWAYIWLKEPGDRGEKRSLWFRPGDKLPPLPAGKWDVYFDVNLSTVRRSGGQRTKIEHIGQVAALYADMDGWQDLEALRSHFDGAGVPLPSAIVGSGGGFHCYWFLAEPLTVDDANREDVRAVQRAWVHHVGGDPAAVCITRVLRLPGAKNHKPARNGAAVELVELHPNRRYAYADLRAIVADRIAQEQGRAKTKRTSAQEAPQSPPPAISVDDAALAEKMRQHPRIADLWRGDLSAYGNDHSAADQALCNHLAWWTRCDRDQMDRLFRKSGLYRRKWERADYRERTIDSAIAGCVGGYDPDHHTPTEEMRADLADALREARQFAMSGYFAEEVRATQGANPEGVRDVYMAIVGFVEEFGRTTVSPGVAGIAKVTGAPVGTVHRHLAALETMGLIGLDPDRKRGKPLVINLIVGAWKTYSPAPL